MCKKVHFSTRNYPSKYNKWSPLKHHWECHSVQDLQCFCLHGFGLFHWKDHSGMFWNIHTARTQILYALWTSGNSFTFAHRIPLSMWLLNKQNSVCNAPKSLMLLRRYEPFKVKLIFWSAVEPSERWKEAFYHI